MNERDTHTPNESAGRPDAEGHRVEGRHADDRRGQVNPVDKPVPHSPEPEHDAVRAGEEKLERVKPY